MLRNDDNAYKECIAIILQVLFYTSQSNSITLYMHSMSSNSLGRNELVRYRCMHAYILYWYLQGLRS